MAGEYELAVEGYVELARATGNEFEFAVTFGFKQRLRTEGAVLVASRLAVVNLYFHMHILPDFRHQRKQH